MAPPAVLVLLAALLAAGPAWSGAWPREPGGIFLSFRVQDDGEAALYGEYGLSRRVTLGGQFGTGERHEAVHDDLPPPQDGRVSAFARLAIGPLDAAHRFAVSAGISAPPDTLAMATGPRLEAGLHWGWGFESTLGGGWATASARVLSDPEQDRSITDLSALIGLRPVPRTMAMIGLSRWQEDDGTYWKISPSAGYEVRPDVWLVPQVSRDFGDASDTTFSLSVWLSF
jgi:hypothetical protein